jgi:hypothetical protein
MKLDGNADALYLELLPGLGKLSIKTKKPPGQLHGSFARHGFVLLSTVISAVFIY